jgi:hypothetical protein
MNRLGIGFLIVLIALALMVNIGCGGGVGHVPSSSASSNGSTAGNTSAASNPSNGISSTPSASSDFDSYPSTATVNHNLESAKWVSCNCGGTGAEPASASISQTSETATANIRGGGKAVSGWLWYSALSGENASNWIVDYELTPTELSGAAALEFDGNQIGSQGNFVLGTECNYGYNPTQKTVWRFFTLSGRTQTWATTNFACPITQANRTYRVQMHFVVSSGTYRIARVKVTDLTAGAVVEDDENLGSYYAAGSHGNSIDIQLDADGSGTVSARYQNMKVIRW